MTHLQRLLVTVTGTALLLLAAALLAREALLAADRGLRWAPPRWWGSLTGSPSAAAVGAVVTAAVALALWLAAARLLRRGPAPAAAVLPAAPGVPVGGETVVTAAALARGLRARLQAALPRATVHEVALVGGRGGEARVVVEVTAPADGLLATAAEAAAVARAGLSGMVGLEAGEVEVAVRELRRGAA